jgi:MoxR-like ATPase
MPGTVSAESLAPLRTNLSKVIRGKDDNIEILVVALLAGGSVLLEDVPGVGKTTLAKALAKSLACEYRRVQFTPDLLPGDILGSSIYNPTTGAFTFRPGPIFCNILLADEINRASPRTQSALLEAMSETQATIEGVSYSIKPPFIVIATQNPIEFHGTYPLPEAQLDRFMISLTLGYPIASAEVDMLQSQRQSHPVDEIASVITRDEVVVLQTAVRAVRVDERISRYIVELANQTRNDARLKLGVSPRGTGMLSRAAQALAFVSGRDYTLPDDVQKMLPYVCAHRVMLTSKAKYSGETKRDIVADITKTVPAPT